MGKSDCRRPKSMTSGTRLGGKAKPMSTAALARFATSACDAVGRSVAPNKSWSPWCSRCRATTNCGPRSPAPPICRQGKRFWPTADSPDRKMDSATTNSDWAWKMEECRAWTKEPVLRTFQIQMTALTLLRLMQFRLAGRLGEVWCPPPPWNLRKRHVSILDLRRLFWKHRSRFSQVMSALDELRKPPQTKYHCGQPTSQAASSPKTTGCGIKKETPGPQSGGLGGSPHAALDCPLPTTLMHFRRHGADAVAIEIELHVGVIGQ
jgi:hypothetical protein